MDIRTARLDLRRALTPLYGDREAAAITESTMEHLTGLARVDRIMHEGESLTEEQSEEYLRCLSELTAWRPVQYVTGAAWFDGHRFRVDERVLIPRPETEELVEWVAEAIGPSEARVLDIGTGSGCIAVAIRKRSPKSNVTALDKSAGALELARQNADELGADIHFLEADILDRKAWDGLPMFDVVVSNPPYVTEEERDAMRPNVTDYEPKSAVFVEGGDPLLFYREIAAFSESRLSPDGSLFFETSASQGEAVCRLLSQLGFKDVLMRRDLQGLDRMVMCRRPMRS
jgi:release factor glutamine methyltransferase